VSAPSLSTPRRPDAAVDVPYRFVAGQQPMTADGISMAYWVNTFRAIRDPDMLAAYSALAGPVMEAHGGRFLARGIPVHAFEHGLLLRTTIIEFPSAPAAIAAYESTAYQNALTILRGAADRDIRIVEAAL
jgi:uncharacterized protein (DUF1330 family)